MGRLTALDETLSRTGKMKANGSQLRGYLWLVRNSKWEIAIVTCLTVAVTLALSFAQTNIYEGQAQVVVNPATNPSSPGVAQPTDLPTERQVADSTVVADLVIQRLHLRTTAAALLSGLTVTQVPSSNVLAIAFDSPSPKTAARVTNAFADAYAAFRAKQSASAYQAVALPITRQITQLHRRLAAIEGQLATTKPGGGTTGLQSQRDAIVAQLGVLQQQLDDLRAGSATSSSSMAQVIQPATVPASPVRPQKVRNAILGLFGGLALGIGLGFFRRRLDVRFQTPEEFEAMLGAPVLGIVPRVRAWERTATPTLALDTPQAPVAESYRTLGTNVRFACRSGGIRVVLVTSAVPGEGKSVVCANLAIVLAQAGQRVALVGADLRRPRVHRLFHQSSTPGIADVAAGDSAPDAALHDSGVPGLTLVGSGPTPGDPAAVLGTPRVEGLFDDLRSSPDFDVVLVDAPPVVPVADASILLAYVDAVLFTVDGRSTSAAVAARALSQLRTAGARIVGGVYNRFASTDSTYGDWDYAGYGAEQPPSIATHGGSEAIAASSSPS